MAGAPDGVVPCSIGIGMAEAPDGVVPCSIGMVMPAIGIAGPFVRDAAFLAAPFFLAGVLLFPAPFFCAEPFFLIADFFSGIGMVMPGICIGCAIAGAETAPIATALAAANKIIFTKFLH